MTPFKTLALVAVISTCAFSAAAQTANTATITFTRPAIYADGSALDPVAVAVTYGLYQGLQDQPKTKVATINAVTSTVTTGLLSGSTYCFQVSAIANGVEGDLSLEACKTFPFSKPGVVTITVK